MIYQTQAKERPLIFGDNELQLPCETMFCKLTFSEGKIVLGTIERINIYPLRKYLVTILPEKEFPSEYDKQESFASFSINSLIYYGFVRQ